MLNIYHGPQGIYVAAEGLEQCLFEVGNSLLLFERSPCLRVLRSVQSFPQSLLENLASHRESVFVCKDSQVYHITNNFIDDVSVRGYCSKNVNVFFSPEPVNDFVDFVQIAQPKQFGFVINDARVVVAPEVKLSSATSLYYHKELSFFAQGIFSWFHTILSSRPQDLGRFVENLCHCSLDDVYNSLKSSSDIKKTANILWSKLLVGTEYDALYGSVLTGYSWYDERSITKLEQENAQARTIIEWFVDVVGRVRSKKDEGA